MLIGFIGSPGCGKSTTAFGLCYRLKQNGHAVEFFAEYARYQIMQCRSKNIAGNGGDQGQNLIYKWDSDNAVFYRDHADALCITDGSTLNCHFYGIDKMDFAAEAAKYDLLFYIPVIDVPLVTNDLNRIHNKKQILEMAGRWETKIRPLMTTMEHIIELQGYPHQTTDQMLDAAYAVIEDRLLNRKLAA